ncbi:MAG: DUF4340 domain-containing protein [Bacillota bacterium]|nr:DUF4340 domain-containing protein [Bacillota bacterium]
MKFYKNAVILLIIVVILSVTYFISTRKASNTTEADKIKIFNFNVEDIKKIEINNKGDKLLFQKESNKWALIQPSDIIYDESAANGLPLNIFYITANKLITEKSNDIAQYGLDNPALVSISTSNNKTDILEIGNLTSSKDNYYAKLKESNKIYTIDKNKIDSILFTKKTIKDKNVLSFRRELRPKTLAEDITSVTLQKNNSIVFSAKKNTDDDSWLIVSPINTKADKNQISPVLDAISKVLALEFIDDNPANFDKYGLKSPAYSLEFQNSNGIKKFYIGSQKNSNEYYARVEGSNDIFTLDSEGFNFLDKPLKGFLQQ